MAAATTSPSVHRVDWGWSSMADCTLGQPHRTRKHRVPASRYRGRPPRYAVTDGCAMYCLPTLISILKSGDGYFFRTLESPRGLTEAEGTEVQKVADKLFLGIRAPPD